MNFFKFLGRIIPSVAGTVVGTMLGGPMGGLMGGALGGSMTRGPDNKFAGALEGAGTALGYQAFAPAMASRFGMTGPMMSSMTGLNSPSLLYQMGMSGAPAMGGGIGLFGNAGHMGLLNNTPIHDAIRHLGHMGQYNFPAGHSLGYASNPQQHYHAHQSYPQEDSHSGVAEEMPAVHHPRANPSVYYGERHRHVKKAPIEILSELSPINFAGKKRSLFTEAKDAEKLKRNLEMLEDFSPSNTFGIPRSYRVSNNKRRFARGGLIKKEHTGYIKESDSGGQDDDIDMSILPDSYVLNATDLSLYGDGSSENGAKKAKKFDESCQRKYDKELRKRELPDPYSDKSFALRNAIPAKVSNDEYVLHPKTVAFIGGGNPKKGSKILDKSRLRLRKHKGVKSILPPKSKPIEYYIKEGK